MRAALALVLIASTAYAEPPKLERVDPPPMVRVDPPPSAKAEAITATVLTGMFLFTGAFAYVETEQRTHDATKLYENDAPRDQQLAAIARTDRWHDLTYTFAALTVVSVAVSGYLWSRAETTYQVAPTPGGGMVGFTSSW